MGDMQNDKLMIAPRISNLYHSTMETEILPKATIFCRKIMYIMNHVDGTIALFIHQMDETLCFVRKFLCLLGCPVGS